MEEKMIKKSVLVLLVACIILVGFGECAGAAEISGIGQSIISHKDSVTISGSGFGVKEQAKPLMWDDCEGETDNSTPRVTANSYSLVGYGDYSPDNGICSGRNNTYCPSSHKIKYRSVYAPVNDTVAAPHDHSNKYLAGGHYDDGNVSGGYCPGVEVTVATPADFEDRWYVTWYYRLNPEWPSCGAALPNHKFSVFQAGTHPFSNAPYTNQFWYQNYGPRPCTHGDVGYRFMARGPVCQSLALDLPDEGLTPPWDNAYENTPAMTNPYSDWIRIEHVISNDQGFMYMNQDNTLVWTGAGAPNFITDNPTWGLGFAGIRSYTVGSFYRYEATGGSTNWGHSDAFRFFDDVYVDSSLSRVMLGDNVDYDSCTVIEPQIPSAWSNNSINVTVNLGKLNRSTAYLFVFDANNTRNAFGYEVVIGEESPPSRSNGQPTGTLPQGTTSTNISLTTNVRAICRYTNISGTNYTNMPFNFTSTNSTSHSTTVTGLENGQTYTYYVRCNSTEGYVNTDNWNITFSIGGHKADLNDDGIINMRELIAFIGRWKANDGVNKAEVLDARGIWFGGGVY